MGRGIDILCGIRNALVVACWVAVVGFTLGFLVAALTRPSHGAEVRSRSGVTIKVAPSAQRAAQCVFDFVEARGIKIKYARGYGEGTVRGSYHPSGRAWDINQYARNRTKPHIPPSVSNAAADACGVVSGARWGWKDNGHWNVRSNDVVLSARKRAVERIFDKCTSCFAPQDPRFK